MTAAERLTEYVAAFITERDYGETEVGVLRLTTTGGGEVPL
jgi:hypothetical protein